MNTPGITVRPIVSIDGSHHLNEVFFDDVRVPVELLVGQENRGWDVAKFLLLAMSAPVSRGSASRRSASPRPRKWRVRCEPTDGR